MKNENNACRTKFQKKIVQNQAAQTSQRLTGIQNKPFRCKNFDYVYIVILSKHVFFFLAMVQVMAFQKRVSIMKHVTQQEYIIKVMRRLASALRTVFLVLNL